MKNLTDEITKLNKKVDKLEKNLADLFGHVNKFSQVVMELKRQEQQK